MICKHQIGIKKQYGTIGQVPKVARKIFDVFKEKYSISWLFRTLSKLLIKVGMNTYAINWKKTAISQLRHFWEPYPTRRYFLLKYHDKYTNLFTINPSISPRSVLELVLNSLHRANRLLTKKKPTLLLLRRIPQFAQLERKICTKD